MTELVSKSVTIFSKSAMSSGLEQTSSKQKVVSFTNAVQVPMAKKRRFYERATGKYVSYTDIAVKTVDINKIKSQSTDIAFDKAVSAEELDTSINDVNQNYEKSLGLLDRNMAFYYNPFSTDGFYAFSIGGGYSFFRRLISIDMFYSYKIIDDETENTRFGTRTTSAYKSKVGANLNISLYRKYNQTLSIGVGFTSMTYEKTVDVAGDSMTLDKKERFSGSALIRYRKEFDASQWGYQIDLKSEDYREPSRLTGSIGLYMSF
jgi:hypothetical protein